MTWILATFVHFVLALQLGHAIRPYTAHLSDQERFTYALEMVRAGEDVQVDPYLIAAVMWHESRFNNLPRNETNDYGLLQVHWQRSKVTWLEGLRREDLLDVHTNIVTGSRELAYMRKFCRARDGKDPGHEWWSHYKYGVVVLGSRYGHTIQWRQKILRRSSSSPAS